MYRTLDGVEWVKPIASLKAGYKERIAIYGEDACDIANKIDLCYKEENYGVKYKSMVIQTDKGIFLVNINFVKGCPIFLSLNEKSPRISQYLSLNGFRFNIEPPNNLEEILSKKQKM